MFNDQLRILDNSIQKGVQTLTLSICATMFMAQGYSLERATEMAEDIYLCVAKRI